jgi:hypothetical protein
MQDFAAGSENHSPSFSLPLSRSFPVETS